MAVGAIILFIEIKKTKTIAKFRQIKMLSILQSARKKKSQNKDNFKQAKTKEHVIIAYINTKSLFWAQRITLDESRRNRNKRLYIQG